MADFNEDFKRRMENRFPFDAVKGIIEDKKVIIAGGAFLKDNPIDFDLYPDTGKKDFKYCENPKGTLLTQSANAKTFKNKAVMQFCRYNKDSLEALVNSFDFAHCQIGAYVDLENEHICDIYYTEGFIKSMITEQTFYTDSQYPLSSLIRIQKYIKRGKFAGKSWIWEVIKILTEVIDRGFHDYEDFKDQLDAVDLGLLPEDFQGANKGGILMNFFELLRRDTGNR